MTCVCGSPIVSVGLSRLSAIAEAFYLLDWLSEWNDCVSIHEEVTGEVRACWLRSRNGWTAQCVDGWL